MKINIWVHKNDIINGKISKYYFWRPQMTEYENYVQVSISEDEFVKLEDKKIDSRSLLEREHKDFPSFKAIVGTKVVYSSGRSNTNYTYPEFIKEHYGNDFH